MRGKIYRSKIIHNINEFCDFCSLISCHRERLMEIDAVLHLADEQMYAAKADSRKQSDEMLVKRA